MKTNLKEKLLMPLQNVFAVRLLLSLIVSLIIVALQQFGALQNLELRFFDQRLLLNSTTQTDERIVIIDETEADIRRFGHPLSDQVLTDALTLVENSGAKVIGMDKYRDIPVAPGTENLKKLLAEKTNIIWVFFAGNSKPEIIPAPEPLTQNQERIGFSNIVKDADGVVRRGGLFLDVEENRYASFPLLIALQYILSDDKETVEFDEQGSLNLKNVQIPNVNTNFGAYQNLKVDGYQTILNYPALSHPFQSYSLSDLFDQKIPPEALKDKIVLFGTSAPSLRDYWLFPNENNRLGVEYHAYFISQLLNLPKQNSISSLSDNVEYGWLFFWSLIGALTGLYRLSIVQILLLIPVQIAVLLGCELVFFNSGSWLPFVAPLVGWLTALFFSVLIRTKHLMEHLAESHLIIEEHKDKTTQLEQARLAAETCNLELARLAATDALTQLANRRCFDEKLASEWQRHLREKQPLTIILGDVDFFKRFNDHYGHPAGDECLRQVAACYRKVVTRTGDLAARYGGEEFVIVMPNTTGNDAAVLAEKLLNTIREMQLPHELSEASPFVSISLGIASVIPESLEGYAELLEKSDTMLYKAKESGRNCCCIDGEVVR